MSLVLLLQSQSPRFDLETHTALIKALKTISGRAEVHQTVIMNMRKEEIVKLMSTATVSPSPHGLRAAPTLTCSCRLQIVISPHCAEFIHTMWMPSTEFSTVMEIFDSGSFVRESPASRHPPSRSVLILLPLPLAFAGDNQMLSEMLHHDHLIVREDGIVPKEKWLMMDVERGDRWDVSQTRAVRLLRETDPRASSRFAGQHRHEPQDHHGSRRQDHRRVRERGVQGVRGEPISTMSEDG